MKKVGYSHSSLQLFDSCPLAYKLTRLDRIPRAKSEPLIIGSTVHEVVAAYLKHLIGVNLQTDWEWAKRQHWVSVPADVDEIWEKFWNGFILPPMENPGVELQLAFNREWEPCEWFAEEAYFRMVVDLTFLQDTLAIVVDWKSDRIIPEVMEKALQTRIYGWGVCKARYPGAQEVLLRFHYLRYGAERELLLTPEDLAGIPQELDAKIALVEKEKHFDPTPGSYCGWCGVMAHCPVAESALVPATILYPVSQADAVKAATLLLAMQTLGDEIKDHLKKWVQEFGPVVVGDMVYGPSISTSYDLDPQEITQELLDAGLDQTQVWPLLNLTKTSLERGLKKLKRQDLLAAILAAAPSKETEKIGFKKIK